MANWYSSTCQECPSACGLLVKTREGRPIKLEGNPEHPVNEGGLCARGQASILNLYDPERLKKPLRGQEEMEWDSFDAAVVSLMKQREIRTVRFLTKGGEGPATLSLMNSFLGQFRDGRQVVYEAVDYTAVARAQKSCYGSEKIPHLRIDRADLLISLGADFLGTWISPVEFTRQFSKKRKVSDKETPLRFVAFESEVTLTGTNADHRVPVEPGQELLVALSLAHEIVVARGLSSWTYDSSIQKFLRPYSVERVGDLTGIDPSLLKELAGSLWKAQGRSLILAGNDESTQIAANFLNTLLKNDGLTLNAHLPTLQATATQADVQKLVEEMHAGKVDLLFVSTDPLKTLPQTLRFKEGLQKVGTVVVLTQRKNLVSQEADYVGPLSHPMESWGDAKPREGLYSLVQPTIEPLYGTRSLAEYFLAWTARREGVAPKSWHETLKSFWKKEVYSRYSPAGSFESFWETTLQKGFFDRFA
ncbi:MAG: hypothetical protein Q7S00_02815, partial [bacterium]|nr:hypothetical protein [bacterium]